MAVKGTVKFDMRQINRLSEAEKDSLRKTAEALRTRVVQAQVVPFRTGNLQNESAFVDYSDLKKGQVRICHSTPYARRLYFHPEYNFYKGENPHAQGRWFSKWLKGGKEADYAEKRFAAFMKGKV